MVKSKPLQMPPRYNVPSPYDTPDDDSENSNLIFHDNPWNRQTNVMGFDHHTATDRIVKPSIWSRVARAIGNFFRSLLSCCSGDDEMPDRIPRYNVPANPPQWSRASSAPPSTHRSVDLRMANENNIALRTTRRHSDQPILVQPPMTVSQPAPSPLAMGEAARREAKKASLIKSGILREAIPGSYNSKSIRL